MIPIGTTVGEGIRPWKAPDNIIPSDKRPKERHLVRASIEPFAGVIYCKKRGPTPVKYRQRENHGGVPGGMWSTIKKTSLENTTTDQSERP